jgi:hypothetical protein
VRATSFRLGREHLAGGHARRPIALVVADPVSGSIAVDGRRGPPEARAASIEPEL